MPCSEAVSWNSCSRFKHCAMHSAIRSPKFNPIGPIGLRAIDNDLVLMSAVPLLLRPAQDLLVWAGVDLTPNWVRTILGLNGHGLHPWEAEVIRQAGAFADRLVLASNPAVQACGRMRLPADYLYVHRSAIA